MSRWNHVKEDIKRKRGKVILLLGGFVVACVMWAPILQSWIATGAQQLKQTARAIRGSQPSSRRRAKQDWRLLRVAQESLSHQAFTNTVALRDPFHGAPSPGKLATNPQQASKPKPVIKPGQVGIQLESTLIVGTSRAARFNSRLVKVGETIRVNGQDTGFTLVEVGERSVVVNQEGNRFTIQLKNQRSGTIKIRRHANSASE